MTLSLDIHKYETIQSELWEREIILIRLVGVARGARMPLP